MGCFTGDDLLLDPFLKIEYTINPARRLEWDVHTKHFLLQSLIDASDASNVSEFLGYLRGNLLESFPDCFSRALNCVFNKQLPSSFEHRSRVSLHLAFEEQA